MYKIVSSLLVVISILNLNPVNGQKNTYSPYSRYGIGELYKTGITSSKAMGGTGIGLRLKNQINLNNPAAYSSLDTLSFLLDFGLTFGSIKYENSSLASKHKNAEFTHLAMSFPVARWMYITAGMTPFSKIGYDIVSYKDIDTTFGIGSIQEEHHEGSGGLNRYLIGSAIKFKNLSFGINLYYLLGSIENKRLVFFPEDVTGSILTNFPTETTNKYMVSDIYFGIGTQYTSKIGEDLKIVTGIIYDFKNNFDTYKNSKTYTYDNSTGATIDTVFNKERIKTTVSLPAKFGIGASLNYKEKFILAVDYSLQNWDGYKNPMVDDNNVLSKSESINLGFQYTPNYKAVRGYLNHVNYRCGAYFSKSYMTFNDNHLSDYGISFGLGLPFLNSRSVFHINYEYGSLGTTKNNLVKHSYHYINLSLTLHDFWFIKSKFD